MNKQWGDNSVLFHRKRIDSFAFSSQQSQKKNIMEFLIGIQGKDFVLVASDTASARSILSMKQGTIEFYLNSQFIVLCQFVIFLKV